VLCFSLACSRQGPSYPPPAQRLIEDYPDPGKYLPFVTMNSRFATEHIVRDIDLNVSEWRWAFAAPQLHFRVPEKPPARFAADIVIAVDTFKVTGPVTIACAIEGRRVGTVLCNAPGRRTVAYSVPPGFLTPGQTVTADLVADKVWTAPTDGARLSFMIFSAGFVD
jgi:hypothetical protein